jgi:hypothetical protein
MIILITCSINLISDFKMFTLEFMFFNGLENINFHGRQKIEITNEKKLLFK